MYTLADLEKYDYFKGTDINYVLDSLTGVLSRAYILGFAQKLVEDKVEFMMGILDVDNFKLVNDNYGHKVGDGCLKEIGTNLAKYVGEDGLVGRFGGDEFIVIYFKSTDYNHVYEYIRKMYDEGNIIRRKFNIDNVSFFVTATIGCASFPKDAKTYDELFITIDKALYRGKTKGRNCYIIYVESKHKNIEVNSREQTSLPNMLIRISEIAGNENNSKDERIKRILDYVTSSLQISEASLLKTDKSVIVSGVGYNCEVNDECLKIFENLTINNNVFVPMGVYNFVNDKKIIKFIADKKIITFMASRITYSGKIFGYIVFFEDKITRIWQEKEEALILYLNKVVESIYRNN